MRTLMTALALLAAMLLVVPPASAGPLMPLDPSSDLPAPAGVPPHGCGTDLDIAPTEEPPPFAVLAACPGIRPGAYHSVEGSGCTFSFVFRGTRVVQGRTVDEGLFIGTAGHCVFDDAEPATAYAPGAGREVRDGSGARVGEVAFGVDEGPLDFGLIRVDDAREADVNPRVCHYGGPVAMSPGGLTRGTRIQHFGNGLVVGDVVQGRSGVFDKYSSGGQVLDVNSAAAPGDSGSAVLDAAGRAIGTLVRLSPVDTGVVEVTDLASHVAIAEATTGITFTLQTAPYTDEPDLPAPTGAGLLP